METKTLVKLCNAEEKANFRKLETASTRLVSVKSHLRFNGTSFNTYIHIQDASKVLGHKKKTFTPDK